MTGKGEVCTISVLLALDLASVVSYDLKWRSGGVKNVKDDFKAIRMTLKVVASPPIVRLITLNMCSREHL